MKQTTHNLSVKPPMQLDMVVRLHDHQRNRHKWDTALGGQPEHSWELRYALRGSFARHQALVHGSEIVYLFPCPQFPVACFSIFPAFYSLRLTSVGGVTNDMEYTGLATSPKRPNLQQSKACDPWDNPSFALERDKVNDNIAFERKSTCMILERLEGFWRRSR